jgi:hypothetical protein
MASVKPIGPTDVVGDRCLPVLSGLMGDVIRELRLICFVRQGVVQWDDAWIEIRAQRPLLVKTANDGTQLAVAEEWLDPFPPVRTAEDEAFIERYGKLEAFDVSAQDPYSQLIGAKVDGVQPLRNGYGLVVGVAIQFGDHSLRVWIDSDECFIVVH